MGSLGDATPPDAMILIWLAPFMISSRTAKRTLSTPSTTRAKAPTRLEQPQGSITSLRGRPSPCPPVCDSARPDAKMRGPSTMSVRVASAKFQSPPPASRTVVKPRISMPFMMGKARKVANTLGWLAVMLRFRCAAITCTWQSIRPGIRVLPWAFTTLVLSAWRTSAWCGPIDLISPFSTQTSWFVFSCKDSTSKTLAD